MDTKLVALVLGLALVFAGALGFVVNKNADLLGATISPDRSAGLLSVYNQLALMLSDIVAVRAPLANMVASSTTWNPASLAAGIATTSITGLGANIESGDLCWAVVASSSNEFENDNFTLNCSINGAGAAWITLGAASGTATNLTTHDLIVRAIDLDTFVFPAALQSSTSTTAGE